MVISLFQSFELQGSKKLGTETQVCKALGVSIIMAQYCQKDEPIDLMFSRAIGWVKDYNWLRQWCKLHSEGIWK